MDNQNMVSNNANAMNEMTGGDGMGGAGVNGAGAAGGVAGGAAGGASRAMGSSDFAQRLNASVGKSAKKSGKKWMVATIILAILLAGSAAYIIYGLLNGTKEIAGEKVENISGEISEGTEQTVCAENQTVESANCSNQIAGEISSLLARAEHFRYYFVVKSVDNFDMNSEYMQIVDNNNIEQSTVHILNLTGDGQMMTEVNLAEAFRPMREEYLASTGQTDNWADDRCLASYATLPTEDLSYSGIDFAKEAAFVAYYKCKVKSSEDMDHYDGETSLGSALYAYDVESGSVRMIKQM